MSEVDETKEEAHEKLKRKKHLVWQGWTEKKGLAKLAVDTKALGSLLEFYQKRPR